MIGTRHKLYGAALIQIINHPDFKSIEPLLIDGEVISNFYILNRTTVIHLKYAKRPNSMGEYVFNIKNHQHQELQNIAEKYDLYVLLICDIAGIICLIHYVFVLNMKFGRDNELGYQPSQYNLLVKVPFRGKLHVLQSESGRRRGLLEDYIKVARSDFPKNLFQN